MRLQITSKNMLRWTDRDTDLLKLNYGNYKVSELIAKFFPRKTEQQIYNKVHRLRKAGHKFKGD